MINSVTIVEFGYDVDSILAVYVTKNSKTFLYMYGDYYHDKIHEWTRGFTCGLNENNDDLRVNYYRILSDNCKEILEGTPPPKSFTTAIKKFEKVWESGKTEGWLSNG